MARNTPGYRKYSKLEETSKVARMLELSAYIRAVIWIIVGFTLAKGPFQNLLSKGSSIDSSLVTVLSMVLGLFVVAVLILVDTWISSRLTRKMMIRKMFGEVNLSEDLRQRALSAFLTKGSPAYGNEYYAYVVASAVKRSDNERKRKNITTEEYKKIVTDLVDNIGKEQSEKGEAR